jgi:RNA polymerase sigma factor (TIGR02999 family)
MADATQILSDIESGDPSAADQLLPLVYEELRKLAAAKLANEKPGQTLQATALVHEAYVRLVDVEKAQHWNSRGHFFGAAAEAMRRILIESARRKQRVCGDPAQNRVELDEVSLIGETHRDELLDLNEALERFSRIDPASADLVKLRIFAGLNNDEAAALQNLPPSTAKKRWMYARSWLRREMSGGSKA